MDLPRTIVVGTDFSEQAEAAIAYAVALAGRLDARVRVVHGWQLPPMFLPVPEAAPVVYPAQLAAQLQTDAEAAMQHLVERHRAAHVPIEGAVVGADPRDAVLAQAAAGHAELIVVGTHGRRGFQRALLGSVAEAIVRHAPCPVLVVRAVHTPPA